MNKAIAENLAQGTSNFANKVFDKVDGASVSGRGFANQGARKTQELLEAGIR